MRSESKKLHTVSWLLNVAVGTLSGWSRQFDENLQPYMVDDLRGRSGTITIEVVRQVVDAARQLKDKGRRLRIKTFVRHVKEQLRLDLGRTSIEHILIANDLRKPKMRSRQPKFYQSLCCEIPNGLVSLDGSELTVMINGRRFKFNVELAVDVGSFCHTGYSIDKSETADAVIASIEEHRRRWGLPLGVVFDHGSANMGSTVDEYLKSYGIEIIPVGPGNPKGNGTDESAFSQLKQTVGTIDLNGSSLRALAQSVLKAVVAIYIKMRNRMLLHKAKASPLAVMQTPVSKQQRQMQQKKLAAFKQSRIVQDVNQPKIDQLHGIIDYYQLSPDTVALARAESYIKQFAPEAIAESVKAFLKAVKRDPNRKNLYYFFGILKNVQQKLDAETYAEYCRQRYNCELMLENERRHQEMLQADKPPTVELIVNMAAKAVGPYKRFIKKIALSKTRQWLRELIESVKYVGTLKKNFIDAIGSLNNIYEIEKEKIWALLESLLDPKTAEESVTLFS